MTRLGLLAATALLEASLAKGAFGKALPIETFDTEVLGDSAHVTYAYDVAVLNQTDQSWVHEDDTWRYDDC